MGVGITELEAGGKPSFDLPSEISVREFFPFEKMRDYQGDVLTRIIGGFRAGYRHIILEAPAGFGKSAIAIALCQFYTSLQKSSYIIVSSKYLQDQYLKDFRTVSVKGRGNFNCIEKEQTCDVSQRMGKVFRCGHMPKPSGDPEGKVFLGESARRGPMYVEGDIQVCPYWKQKCEAMQHPFPLFNYDYFLHETQHVGDFGKREIVVCDEAHNMESKLMRFIGLEIGSHDLEALKARIPDRELKISTWMPVLGEWRDLFAQKIMEMERHMEKLTPPELERLEDYGLKAAKCEFILKELNEDPDLWVVSSVGYRFKGRDFKKFVFKPIEVKKWGKYIFSKGEHFLLQSATILSPSALCTSMGIEGEVLYIRVPSIFPAERRLFYFRGVGKMSRGRKEETLPFLIREVERIIRGNPSEKGVIHTHTYSIQQEIFKRIKNERLMFNDGRSTQEVFEKFKSASEPLVLVTPSAFEGVDFKGDECRWQILCKVPYPDLGDPQVKKRAERDKDWYDWLTALRIVQTYGRGMRSADDFCATYMLDSDFGRFYSQKLGLFPEWFRAAVR